MEPYEIGCPMCDKVLNLFDDEFFNCNLLSDADNTMIKCSCGHEILVETIAVYAFNIVDIDGDEQWIT